MANNNVSYLCGHCTHQVSGRDFGQFPSPPTGRPNKTLDDAYAAKPKNAFQLCPNCERGTVIVDGIQHPSAPAGAYLSHLPADVESSWQEARRSYAAGAYTASTLMCRKLLMHMACDKANTDVGESFTVCIDDLIASNELPKSHEPALQSIRQSGNDGTHKLESIGEAEAKATVAVTEQCLRNLYELPAQICAT